MLGTPMLTTTVYERPQGTIKRIKCWFADENGQQVRDDNNAYLIEQGDLHVLVDTCRGDFGDLVVEECAKTGVDAIVLTHGHFDHCQNVARLVERFGCKVLLNSKDFDLVGDQTSVVLTAETDLGKGFLEAVWPELETEKIDPFTVDYTYDDGDSLADIIGLAATAFFTPGHCPGHMAIDLWGSDLFVGDILMNPMGDPVRALMGFDFDLINESVEKILAIEGDRMIHFGHGDERLISESNF